MMSDRETVQDCINRGVPIPPGIYKLRGRISATQIRLSNGAYLIGSTEP